MKFYLTTEEAAKTLGVTQKTLRKWRMQRRGPGYIKYGNTRGARCFYPIAGLEHWLTRHEFKTED